jgi:hypothetical protein
MLDGIDPDVSVLGSQSLTIAAIVQYERRQSSNL